VRLEERIEPGDGIEAGMDRRRLFVSGSNVASDDAALASMSGPAVPCSPLVRA
jgi:hypothetical protein